MKQMKCPNCGSRTTDVELASFDGHCIGCRKSYDQAPLGGIGKPEAPPCEVDLDDLTLGETGSHNMLFGALWCLGGMVVTAATLATAYSLGGGVYVVASGAIIFGALQFFRGVFQKVKSRRRGRGSA